MGGSKSESDSSSSSAFNQDVWGPQGSALKDLYSSIGGLFGQTSEGMQGQIPGAVGGMQGITDTADPAWQNQLAGGAYKDMGLQNSLMASLNQSMGQPSAMSEINAMIMGGEGNTYADAMKSQYMQDANQAQQQMMSNMDARAVGAGQSGSSRHGVAQGIGMEDINKNLQRNLAETGFGTFDKDLERKLEIAGMADQGTLARQNMMSNMIGQQNQAMQGGLDYGSQMQNLNMGQFAPYMMPWQAAGAYGNIIGAPTILGSGSMAGDSSSKGLSGGIGGGK